MVRLFTAIDLPDAVKDQLAGLASSISGAKWVRREGLHLTLRFIGEVDQPQSESIQTALKTVHHAPFTLRLKGVGQFPPKGKLRVLWVGIDASPALNQLYQQIETALRKLDLPPDDHSFSPHITLARFKSPPDAEQVREYHARHATFETQMVDVREFILFSSTLTSEGAIYRPEAVYPLTI